MMMRIKYIPGLLLLLMLLGQSCISDDMEKLACPTEPESLSLRVFVTAPDNARGNLRSTEMGEDLYNENKIESFTVLFYNEGNIFWEIKSGDLQESAGTYIIPVPEDKKVGFDGVKVYNVYVVANHTFTAAPATEILLKKQVVSESVKENVPTKFVMLGSISKQVDMSTIEGKTLGTIQLKRVASKVRLITPEVEVNGYEQVGDIEAQLRFGVDRGYLNDNNRPVGALLFNSNYRKTIEPAPGNKTSAHFYSYYAKWNNHTAHEQPTLHIKIMMKKSGEPDSTAKAYFYKVPVEPDTGMELLPNMLYNVTVRIEILGDLTQEDPKKVIGAVKVEEWTEHDDEFGLPAVQYLVVSDHKVFMNNTNQFSLKYQSSKKPISITITNVSFTYVNQNGQEITTPYPPGSDMYPTITFDEEKIHISSKIPVNNITKDITFEVTNGVPGLKEIVTVEQYPAQYITYTMGTASNLQPGGHLAPGLNNKSMYHINVLVAPGDMILGFPPTNSNGDTENSLETSKILSPSFELASQLGATPRTSYNDALTRCRNYWEKRIVGGVTQTLDDWRLPTEAEIRLVDQLQHDPNSAVHSIMTGRYYWDAYSANGAYKMIGGDGSANQWSAHVRCVRDVKDNTTQD